MLELSSEEADWFVGGPAAGEEGSAVGLVSDGIVGAPSAEVEGSAVDLVSDGVT